MASVTVKMGTCGNVTKISVTRGEKGRFTVGIESSCHSVRSYALLVKEITMEDIMGVRENIVLSYDNIRILTPSCLVPSGVMTAAWLEIGMLPVEMVKERSSSVSF